MVARSSLPSLVNVYVNCTPGMESDLARELQEIRSLCLSSTARLGVDPLTFISEERGGIEIETSLMVALQINFWSKLASRVLVRLASFHAGSLPRLRERLKNVPRQGYLGSRPFEVRVEAHQCQVANEKTIRRVMAEIWPIQEKVAGLPRIYVRGFKDEWTVSIDTSGEHLHRRGYRIKAGGAPLRETLAALTIRHLLHNDPVSDLEQVQLLDPMVGSGTFLREAAEIYQPNQRRKFAFQSFQNCPALLKSPTFWENYRHLPFPQGVLFSALVGIEQDANVAEVARENVEAIKASDKASKRVCIHSASFQSRSSRSQWGLAEDQPLWIVANPPYGERLQDLSWMEAWWPWVHAIRADRMALWLPRSLQHAFLQSSPQKPSRSLTVANGGLPCVILFFDMFQNSP